MKNLRGRKIKVNGKFNTPGYTLRNKMLLWGIGIFLLGCTLYTMFGLDVIYAYEFPQEPRTLPTIEEVRQLCALEDVECPWEAKLATKQPRHEVKIPEIGSTPVEQQIRQIAQEKNFKWPDYLVRLAICENRELDPSAINDKGNDPAWSVDRGIFQINDYWHEEVSNECAFDLRCATGWTMWRINSGFQSEWVCDRYI